MNYLSIFLLFGILLNIHSVSSKRIVCYYTNWSQYRLEGGKYFPEDLDPKLCTHVIFAFAKLTGNNLEAFEWNDEDTDWSQGMYSRMMALKRQNSQLKVLLAVGGWNVGAEPFSKIVHNEDSRKAFIKQSVQFLLDHKFDGLDLDWEYPGSRSGSQPTDKPLFTILCKEFNEALKPHGLLLTAAVGMGIETIEKAYEIAEISTYLDWINMMAYDLHGAWEKFVGHNAPLYARKDETGVQATLNVDYAVRYWLDHGAPAEKLALGLGTYGRAFTLKSSSKYSPGSPAINPGEKGKYTREAGFLSYYEICEKIQIGWKVEWDSEAMVPYAHRGKNWVGFDDEQSMIIKANYAKLNKLGGIMFWAVDLDDYTGNFCGKGKYPLMKAAVEAYKQPYVMNLNELNEMAIAEFATKTNTPIINTARPDIVPPGKRVVCYYTNWSQYRPEGAKFFPEDIDPSLCNTVIIAFAKITDNSLEAIEWNDEDTEWSKGMYTRINALKESNPDLKILMAVGGWNVGPEPFSRIVHDDESRKEFVLNTVDFLLDHKFDGLDLDWEYPGSRSGSQPTDKPLFTILCKEFNEALKPHGLLLTAAVGMGIETIEKAYEIAEISTYLDWINMMAYDLHGAWEKFVGHNAPLYARKDETGYQATLNVNHTVSYWLEHGAPAKKLVLGLGTYGRAFTLAESSDFLPGTTAKNPGEKGKYTREAGFLSYYEICEKIDKENWNVEWDSEAMVPYAHQGLNWVGYDNKESLEIKVQYAKKLGLGGIMFWSLALDDFTGNFCGEGKYPLLNAAVEALNNDKNDTPEELNQQIQVNTDTKTTRNQAIYTATSKPTETTKSLIDVLCSNGNGYYLDRADDCSGYYVCLFIGTPNAQIKKLKCPDGLHFDESKSVCAHADSFNCDLKTSTKMTTRKATTVTTTTKTTAETTTTKKSTTKLIEILNKNVKCPNGNGFYTDRAANCYRYYFCAMANTPDEIIQYFSCQGDMKYNENTKKCDTNVYDC